MLGEPCKTKTPQPLLLPAGVIGNTGDSGSFVPGSNPGWGINIFNFYKKVVNI